jgi:hypothetical protein
MSEGVLRDYYRRVGWHDVYVEAPQGTKDAEQVLRWLDETLRERRTRYRKVGLWAPLACRLSALGDLEWLRGFQEGFTKTLEKTVKDPRG